MDKDRRCLVLGAGHVGGRLCRRLREAGYPVAAAARFSRSDTREELAGLGVRAHRFDITRDDPAALPEADLVFLEIWDPTRPELIWPINFFGVGRVVARYAGLADFVNGSTAGLYDPAAETPQKETDLPRPVGEYALSRFAQEKLIDFFCAEHGSRAVHLRYAHANAEDAGVILHLARKILKGESVGSGEDRIQVIGMEDFVRCTAAAADLVSNPPRVINICHPRVWTMRELGQRIRQELGRGEVVTEDAPAAEKTMWDASLMIEEFGPPQEDIEELIGRVCRAALAE